LDGEFNEVRSWSPRLRRTSADGRSRRGGLSPMAEVSKEVGEELNGADPAVEAVLKR
jgi:hypothetical protein